jgi:hypothetical protein
MAWLVPVMIRLIVILRLLIEALAARNCGDGAPFDPRVARALVALARVTLRLAARHMAALAVEAGETEIAPEGQDAAPMAVTVPTAATAAVRRRRPGAAIARRRAGMRVRCARPVPSRTRIGGLCPGAMHRDDGRTRGVPMRPPDRTKRGLRPAFSAVHFVTVWQLFKQP